MEILKGYPVSVEFYVPQGTDSAIYEISRNGKTLGLRSDATINGTTATVSLPYAAVAENGDINVTLTFYAQGEAYTTENNYSVYTPILSLKEIGDIIEDTDEVHQR